MPESEVAHSAPARRSESERYFATVLRDSPWRVGDLTSLATRLALGAVGMGIAWNRAAATLNWRNQLLWSAFGIGALVVAVGGIALWLLSGMGTLSRERHDVLQLVRGRRALRLRTVDGPGDDDTDDVVSTAAMRRYHRHDCQLVQGKAVRRSTRVAYERSGLAPCGICQP